MNYKREYMKGIILGLSMTLIMSLCMAQTPLILVGPDGLPEPEQKTASSDDHGSSGGIEG